MVILFCYLIICVIIYTVASIAHLNLQHMGMR